MGQSLSKGLGARKVWEGFDGASPPFLCQMCRIEILASEAQGVMH